MSNIALPLDIVAVTTSYNMTTDYQLTDATGRVLSKHMAWEDAAAERERVEESLRWVDRERERAERSLALAPVPDGAHAAVDAMVGEFAHPDDDDQLAGSYDESDAVLPIASARNPDCSCGRDCQHDLSDDDLNARWTPTDDTPLPLHAALRLEADVLERTGTLGPHSRAVLASLVRDYAAVAKVTDSTSVEQLVDRMDVVEPV